jgi:hypothetical protein
VSAAPLLVQVLRAPGAMARLTLPEWDLLLRQALAANLTATLYCLAREHGLLDALPEPPRRHLAWAAALLRRHGEGVRFEVARIGAALARSGVPLLLLKGAAYAMAGLPPAQGRLFSDIDILVPRADIERVEAALMLAGWASQHLDPYDQRYYRVWMHEIPPMQHLQRASTIDVHHAILPLTARARPDPARLRAASVALEGGVRVLAPADMVIHSATHLFYDGARARTGAGAPAVLRAAPRRARAAHAGAGGGAGRAGAGRAQPGAAGADGCAVRARPEAGPRQLRRAAQRLRALAAVCARQLAAHAAAAAGAPFVPQGFPIA